VVVPRSVQVQERCGAAQSTGATWQHDQMHLAAAATRCCRRSSSRSPRGRSSSCQQVSVDWTDEEVWTNSPIRHNLPPLPACTKRACQRLHNPYSAVQCCAVCPECSAWPSRSWSVNVLFIPPESAPRWTLLRPSLQVDVLAHSSTCTCPPWAAAAAQSCLHGWQHSSRVVLDLLHLVPCRCLAHRRARLRLRLRRHCALCRRPRLENPRPSPRNTRIATVNAASTRRAAAAESTASGATNGAATVAAAVAAAAAVAVAVSAIASVQCMAPVGLMRRHCQQWSK
jgi:hypothetical protein